MQVVCANCQLSFQAPEGATGLLCPICRSPLRPPDGDGKGQASRGEASGPSARQVLDWAGGSLDDLIALLSGPSWSARVEVLPAGKDVPAGEVHVIAGGVADAIFAGKSSHDSLDNLRAIVAKGTHFRVEPRLPNPEDGNLSMPGPEQGKLEDRPLATLMRYCEDFVLTCGIEVWRGSENAKVEYRRGDIVGVTVGGIDAPERLAEVMKWASGNYRLVVPKLTLPPTAPKTAPAPVPVTPRATGAAASRTIFGMPAIDVATLAAARAKMSPAPASASTAATNATVQLSDEFSSASSSTGTASGVAAATPQKSSSGAHRGVVASGAPAEAPTGPHSGPSASAAAASAGTLSPTPPPAAPPSTPSSRQNPNRTIFGVAAAPFSVAGREASARTSNAPAPIELRDVASEEISRPPPTPRVTRPGAPVAQLDSPAMAASGATSAALVAKDDDRTSPSRALANTRATATETGVLTYVGVGIVFGLALLGVYRLFTVFIH
jgi:hypothetical protein